MFGYNPEAQNEGANGKVLLEHKCFIGWQYGTPEIHKLATFMK